MTNVKQRNLSHRWILGIVVACSFLLSGCFDCGWPKGVTDVVVEPDRMIAWVVYDDVLEGPRASSLISTDLGETWSYVELEDSDSDFEVSKETSWCGDGDCYEIDGLAVRGSTSEGGVLWEPPAHRADFIENGGWGTSDRPCLGSQEGPMSLESIDGGTVGEHEVVLVAAGLDGVLLRVDGGDFERVGVGDLSPRPFTAFGKSLGNSELLVPIGMAALALIVAASMIRDTYRQQSSSGGAGRIVARLMLWLILILVALVASLLAMWMQSQWLSVTIMAWLWALAIVYRRRNNDGRLPVALLAPAWALPALLGWLPLLGWSLGVPAARSVAMILTWVVSVLAVVLSFLFARSRLASSST